MKPDLVHAAPDPGALKELYEDAGWHSDLDIRELGKSIEATTHWLCAVLPDENRSIIGMVRLQTDFVFYCAVYDLLVHSDHRGEGIGSALMDATLSWAREQRIKQVHLWPVSGLAGFYERFGFESLGSDQPLMRITPS